MRYLKKVYMGLLLLFLYLPIFVLIIFSFNESKSRGAFTGFTFKWYIELFSDRNIQRALFNTLIIGFTSSGIATAVGTITAIGIHYLKKSRQKVYLSINNIPVVNPDIVTGVSLMILFLTIFRFLGFGKLGFETLLIAHIVFNIPYVILSVLPKLKQVPSNLFEASLDLGATPLYTIFNIILPEVKSGIIAGFVLCLTLSIDDFVISFFTTGSGVNTLSILVYSMSRRGVNPEINALSTLLFLTVLILLALITKINNKNPEIED